MTIFSFSNCERKVNNHLGPNNFTNLVYYFQKVVFIRIWLYIVKRWKKVYRLGLASELNLCLIWFLNLQILERLETFCYKQTLQPRPSRPWYSILEPEKNTENS